MLPIELARIRGRGWRAQAGNAFDFIAIPELGWLACEQKYLTADGLPPRVALEGD